MKSFIAFILTIPQALMAALVFSCFWQWFLVRKFPGLPSLTTLDAVGLLMVLGFPLIPLMLMRLKAELRRDKPDMDAESAGITLSILMTVMVYPILLGIGWIWLKVNGQTKQNANLNQMIWSVAEQISKLSDAFELMPGDIIYSGTPENVGPVVRGDVIDCHIDGLPNLSVKIV